MAALYPSQLHALTHFIRSRQRGGGRGEEREEEGAVWGPLKIYPTPGRPLLSEGIPRIAVLESLHRIGTYSKRDSFFFFFTR